MSRNRQTCQVLTVARLLLTAEVALLCSCKSPDPVMIAPPPPGPVPPAPAEQSFYYDHEIRVPEVRTRERKIVIALMRPGDTERLASVLPFGRSGVIVNPNDGRPMEVTNQGAPVLMTPQIRQFLMRELVESEACVVVERERILEIVRELEFGRTEYIAPDGAPELGHLMGVHFILEGAYLPPDRGDDVAAQAEMQRAWPLVDLGNAPNGQSAIYLNLFDVETGQIKAVSFGADANPALAVYKAVEDLLAELGDTAPPIKVGMAVWQSGTRIVMLDIGSEDGVKSGDIFKIVAAPSRRAEVEDPAKPLGILEVLRVDPLHCLGKIMRGGERITKGDVAQRTETLPRDSRG